MGDEGGSERSLIALWNPEQVGYHEHRQGLGVLAEELAFASRHEAIDLLVGQVGEECCVFLQPLGGQQAHHQPAVGGVVGWIPGDERLPVGEGVPVPTDQLRDLAFLGEGHERAGEGVA